MSYHTCYSLEIIGASRADQESIFDMLEDLGVLRYALQRESGTEYGTYEPCNWWCHESDMLELSQKHPQVRFTLHGEGECNDDIWESHYLNGKTYTQGAIITIPPFDPVLLRDPGAA